MELYYFGQNIKGMPSNRLKKKKNLNVKDWLDKLGSFIIIFFFKEKIWLTLTPHPNKKERKKNANIIYRKLIKNGAAEPFGKKK